MTVADRIKEKRELLGLTQYDLAEKLGLKSATSITRIEKSGDNVSLKDVRRIADILGCSEIELMFDDKQVVEYAMLNPNKTKVNIYDVERVFERYVEQAIKLDHIQKPISWALCQTWKWADKNEKEREVKDNACKI